MKTYLYRCFDRDNQLIYVGVAENVERRRKEHAKDKFWWPDVTKVTVMAFETRAQALWAEWAVITTCNPIYNKSATVPAAPDTPPPFVEYGSTGSPRPGLWSRLIHRSAPVPVLPEPEFVEAAPDPERNHLAEQEFPEAEPAVPARPSRGAMMPPGMSLERQRAWRIKFGVPEPEPVPEPGRSVARRPRRTVQPCLRPVRRRTRRFVWRAAVWLGLAVAVAVFVAEPGTVPFGAAAELSVVGATLLMALPLLRRRRRRRSRRW